MRSARDGRPQRRRGPGETPLRGLGGRAHPPERETIRKHVLAMKETVRAQIFIMKLCMTFVYTIMLYKNRRKYDMS